MNSKTRKYHHIDELEIKKHLDTSFDLEQISVSEELIHRTLAAINHNESEHKEEEKTRKTAGASEGKILHYHKYMKRFAGVAAAAFLIFVGYYSVHIMGELSKKDSTGNMAPERIMDQKYSDGEGYDTGTAEERNAVSPETTDQQDTDMAIMSPDASDEFVAGASGELPKPENGNLSSSAGTGKDAGLLSQSGEGKLAAASDQPMFAFQDIIPVTPDQVKLVRITENGKNEAFSYETKADIENFYQTMGSYQYVAGDDSTGDYLYTIEIKGLDQTANEVTLWIGDVITIQNSVSNTVTKYNYQSVDPAGLLGGLQNLIDAGGKLE